MVTTNKPTVEDALKVIAENGDLVFIDDVRCALIEQGFARLSAGTFYKLFPKDGDDYGEILDALQANRTRTKRRLRAHWMDSGNPSTEIALYKLLATKEEREALSMVKIDADRESDTIELVLN
jgi:hypothetical protein